MANKKGFGAPSEIIVDGRKMTQEEYAARIATNGSPCLLYTSDAADE